MPHHQDIPEIYRLLAVFSGEPLLTLPALEQAGLRIRTDDPLASRPVPDAHRALLRELHERRGWIRWVKWPGKEGYVLTGMGECALDDYRHRYGPVQVPCVGLGELARQRLAEARQEGQASP